MQGVHQSGKPALLFFIAINFIVSLFVVALIPGTAFAMPSRTMHTSADCPATGDITSQSLLVVLLDRSGSLIVEPGATDPDGYSTSVTRALADLWPGSMAVIPFSDNNTPVLGPEVLSDLKQRDVLKNAVEVYHIGGTTPLAPALHQALTQLKDAPAGSRVIIVTDGVPNPEIINKVNQAQDIRSTLIPQFCAQGRPITAFGLALDPATKDGQQAAQLLSAIAGGTNGTYTNVANAHDLAKVVISSYADWQHLIFLPASVNNQAYTIPIDTYAKKVVFVTFRTDTRYPVALRGPAGPLSSQILQQSTDRHYEIDNMVLSDINQPGKYTIQVAGDQGAQVYALVQSRLHVALNQPVSHTSAVIGQPVNIAAELFNGTTPVNPQPNEARINAHIVHLVNGRQVDSQDVELVQEKNSPQFSRQVIFPGPVGQLKVTLSATYLDIPVEASEAQVTIPLLKADDSPWAICGSNLVCYTQRYPVPTSGAFALLVCLILLLFWLFAKGPRGTLTQKGNTVDLGSMRRPISRKLFHKSSLNSQELTSHGDLQFGDARFVLHFDSGVSIKALSDTPAVTVKQRRNVQTVKSADKVGVALDDGSAIQAGNNPPATYTDVSLNTHDE